MNPTSDVAAVVELFRSIVDDASGVLSTNADWAGSGRRDSQYAIDVRLDDLCTASLHDAGLAVLSEESGITGPDGSPLAAAPDRLVVVDPLDGSTNAGLGLPWCATALCLVDDGRPVAAVVGNLRTGDVAHAVRGEGAWLDGRRLRVNAPVTLRESIIATNARPPERFRPRQFRCTGSTALDIVSVASGGFDGSIDFDSDRIGVWDYLAATLIAEEAGAVCADATGRDLVVLDHAARRRPVVASSAALLDELLAAG